jgi:hypothetical protein
VGALGLIPSWAWRWLAIAVVAAGLWGHGYVKGLHHQEAIDEESFAKIREKQDELAIHAGRVALDRSQAVSSIVDTYEAQRTTLSAYYDRRLRDAKARSAAGTLPAAQVPGSAACGSSDLGTCPADLEELRGRCAETTIMLLNLQKAVRAVESIR